MHNSYSGSTYASARYGFEPITGYGVSASAKYYFKYDEYQVGIGTGFGEDFGVNAGYSSFGDGSWSVGGSFAGAGSTYDMNSKSWSYSLDPVAANHYYSKTVKYGATWDRGGDAVVKDYYEYPVKGANNIGTQGDSIINPKGWFNEGGKLSTLLNLIPGINAIAGLHDVFQVKLGQSGGDSARNVFNVPGMIPAAIITFGALISDLGFNQIHSIGR